MESPDERPLRTLFPPGEAFRHKMGLQRRTFDDFYAATAEAAAIRREKESILPDDPRRYTVVSEPGLSAFREFATMLGQTADATDWLEATVELSLRTEPDFLLLLPPDWTLAWASVCFPSHWSLEGKLGLPLHEIHSVVPGLNAELGKKITAFFARMTPGEGWSRANWGLSASDARNQHPSQSVPRLTEVTPAKETFIRVEDQHLIKMPETGAMAFGIRVWHYRLSDLPSDPDLIAALQEKLQTMPADVAEYKGLKRFLDRKL